MTTKQEVDTFVEQRGTGYRRVEKDGRTMWENVDVNTSIELINLLCGQKNLNDWLRLTMKGTGIGIQDAQDVFISNVEKFCRTYDCERKEKPTFSNYFIWKMSHRYLDFLNRGNKDKIMGQDKGKDGKSNMDAVISLEQLEEMRMLDKTMYGKSVSVGDAGNVYLFNEVLLELCKNVIEVLGNISKKSVKYKFFKTFYTNMFLALCTEYENIHIQDFQHFKDLIGNLDTFFIRVIYCDMPNNIEEYRAYPTKTVKELDAYYDKDNFEKEIRKCYSKILERVRSDEKLYDKNIAFPIDKNNIFVAYFYIYDNSVERQEGEEIHKPYLESEVSKRKNDFKRMLKGCFRSAGIGRIDYVFV